MVTGTLTRNEVDELGVRLIHAYQIVCEEVRLLRSIPQQFRDMLYGAGVLASFEGMRRDLESLVHDEILLWSPPAAQA